MLNMIAIVIVLKNCKLQTKERNTNELNRNGVDIRCVECFTDSDETNYIQFHCKLGGHSRTYKVITSL